MKVTFAFLALFASITIAQDAASLDQAGFPKCAVSSGVHMPLNWNH
jgi:hypothetical protein